MLHSFNQPEVLSKYLKAAGGRYLPVNKQVLADSSRFLPHWIITLVSL